MLLVHKLQQAKLQQDWLVCMDYELQNTTNISGMKNFKFLSTLIILSFLFSSNNIIAQDCTNDTTAPVVVTQDITIYLDSNGEATITASQIDGGTTDDCDSSPILFINDGTFDCSNIGVNKNTNQFMNYLQIQ